MSTDFCRKNKLGRLDIGKLGIENSGDVFVDVDDTSVLIRAKSDGTLRTLMNVKQLFDRIKSSETIWFIDEEQLVMNLKKVKQELKWPDIDESWESLTLGITQLLTGISVHVVGDSMDISEAVAKEIAEGIGYLPVCTSELLESATQKSIDTCEAGSLSVPSKVNALPVPVADVPCGAFFTMALTSDEQLWSWGGVGSLQKRSY